MNKYAAFDSVDVDSNNRIAAGGLSTDAQVVVTTPNWDTPVLVLVDGFTGKYLWTK
jgi:hypothetical protein